MANNFMAITHPDDLQIESRSKHAETEVVWSEFSMEKRYFRPDGSMVWVEFDRVPHVENKESN